MFAPSSFDRPASKAAEPPKTKRYDPGEPALEHLELELLRVIGRNQVPIACSDDIKYQTTDAQGGDASYVGATIEVHRACWKDQMVAVKHIRRSCVGETYRRALRTLSMELQLLSKASLRQHRNIPKLLAVFFSEKHNHAQQENIVRPCLIVELAHEQYPNLSAFFDRQRHPLLPKRLSFQMRAALLRDIADGITVLHDHDIVHADLKPENILLFPDHLSSGGIIAKVADFGLVGMTTYSDDGTRAPHASARSQGGTTEWSAPECLDEPDYWGATKSLDSPSYQACSDVYAFGLLSCYIALDGQSPIEYTPNLSRAKLSDTLLSIVITRLESYFGHHDDETEPSFLEPAVHIAKNTLTLEWRERVKSLRSIHRFLGSDEPPVSLEGRGKFVLNFNLFPDTAHQFKHEGLYDAYWASPRAFREKVFESFKKHSSGPFGLHVPAEVWDCMKQEDCASITE